MFPSVARPGRRRSAEDPDARPAGSRREDLVTPPLVQPQQGRRPRGKASSDGAVPETLAAVPAPAPAAREPPRAAPKKRRKSKPKAAPGHRASAAAAKPPPPAQPEPLPNEPGPGPLVEYTLDDASYSIDIAAPPGPREATPLAPRESVTLATPEQAEAAREAAEALAMAAEEAATRLQLQQEAQQRADAAAAAEEEARRAAEARRERLEARRMLAQEVLQRALGDGFWGVDLWTVRPGSSPSQEAEAGARAAMAAEEALQRRRGDGFFGIDAETASLDRERSGMTVADAESRYLAAVRVFNGRRANWEREDAVVTSARTSQARRKARRAHNAYMASFFESDSSALVTDVLGLPSPPRRRAQRTALHLATAMPAPPPTLQPSDEFADPQVLRLLEEPGPPPPIAIDPVSPTLAGSLQRSPYGVASPARSPKKKSPTKKKIRRGKRSPAASPAAAAAATRAPARAQPPPPAEPTEPAEATATTAATAVATPAPGPDLDRLLRSVFEAVDLDGEGAVSRAELREAMRIDDEVCGLLAQSQTVRRALGAMVSQPGPPGRVISLLDLTTAVGLQLQEAKIERARAQRAAAFAPPTAAAVRAARGGEAFRGGTPQPQQLGSSVDRMRGPPAAAAPPQPLAAEDVQDVRSASQFLWQTASGADQVLAELAQSPLRAEYAPLAALASDERLQRALRILGTDRDGLGQEEFAAFCVGVEEMMRLNPGVTFGAL